MWLPIFFKISSFGEGDDQIFIFGSYPFKVLILCPKLKTHTHTMCTDFNLIKCM